MFKKFSPVLFLLFILLVGCSKQPSSHASSDKPRVLVSIAPYAYFVERIAQDSVSIQNLVPLGVNPHMFEPSPREVHEAYGGALWLRIGEPFEEKIASVLKEQNPNLAIIEMWKSVPLLSTDEVDLCSHGGHVHPEAQDRHIWLSLRLAKVQAQKIEEALVKLLPDQREMYEKNLNAFLKELDALDQQLTEKFAPMRGDAILVSHAAFGYFCHDYGLVQLSVECEGKDPLPQNVNTILKKAQEMHVRSVLVQSSFNNKGSELIAERLELPIYSVDPYARDYLNNLRYLAEAIFANPCAKKS